MEMVFVLLACQSGFIFTMFGVVSGTETINVCEDEKKTITCDGGIGVISARYGRFDRVTCPHSATSKVGCFTDVLKDIKSKCEGKTTCTVSPSNGQYGDPCSGTFKYIEVQLYCPPVEATTTTTLTTTTPTTTTSITTTTKQSTTQEVTTGSIPSTAVTTTGSPTVAEFTTKTTTLPSTISITTITAGQSTTQQAVSVSSVPSTHIAITDRNDTNTSSFLSANSSCVCRCRYVNDTSCDSDDLPCLLTNIRHQLTINKTTLSSFKRTKISAYDGRTSATVLGMSGVAVIVTVLALIVIPDLFRLIKYMFSKKHKGGKHVFKDLSSRNGSIVNVT